MAQEIKNKGPLKDGKVNKTDRVEVVGTGSSQFFPKELKREVHPELAKTLRAKGSVK